MQSSGRIRYWLRPWRDNLDQETDLGQSSFGSRLLILDGEMELLQAAAPPLLLSWPAKVTFTKDPIEKLLNSVAHCRAIHSKEDGLEMVNLPAPGKSPLSSAVVTKPKDGDDGGGRADLLGE